MAGTPETLFFFEVFVDYVRFNGAGKVDKVKPAVGVRFLDFPTLLIYSSEDHNFLSKTSSDKRLSSSCASSPTGEESVAFCFKKGKSCLFKISLDALHTHLSSTPVYTMLLDVGGDDVPKLIGSSFMSLAKLTASIKLDVEKHGIWTPAAYGENRINCLLNLMGERIGTISLACKLVSLAASSIPNITKRNLELSTGSETNPTKSAIAEENLNNKMSVDKFQPPHPENSTVTSTYVQQPLCINKHPVLSETSKTNKLHISSVCSQEEQHIKEYRASFHEVKSGGDQLCSTFCPPPLFYNSSRRNPQQLSAKSYQMVNTTAESLRMMDLTTKDCNNETCRMECVHRVKEEPKKSEEAGLHPSSGTLISQTEPTVLRDAIRQLPLLSTLLIELSHLNGQLQLQQPLPVQSAQEGFLGLMSAISPQTNVLQTALSLVQGPDHSITNRDLFAECTGRNTHGNSHVSSKSCISPFISTKKQPVGSKSHRELSHPKQKLRYGLTHSFRLRLRQIKPGLMRHHECMEKSKTRVIVNSQKKTSAKEDHTSASQSFSRDLEKCGQTTETDCLLPETAGLSHSQKSSMGKDFHNKRDKVHVQSAPGQHFDHSTYEKETDPFYLVQKSTDLQGSSESDVGNNGHYRPSHRSDSNSESSPEPCKYQDDFTSLDPTDGSPNPLSSPEPSRPQMTQISSGSSSLGSSSSVSSVHKSRPHPVPVKTQTSPKRSLKGTCMIKPVTAALSDSTPSGLSDDAKSRNSVHPHRNSESYRSFPESPTVSRKVESPMSDQANEIAPMKEQYVDKFQTSDEFMLESVSSTGPKEKMDKLSSLGFQNKYLPISKLVVNQLPGYTL
ncbi:microtubule-associated protein 10 [Astyanax mexicanus]|uniref:Microtubule-associated protein 10 n=1 Tax=Astyanax mexicanus TaxID=7994 RepID=A0A8T2LT00_ASTMX|nr:microtubule-associated protein 10 [Astyanax mexicanus]